jgi:4-hydroxybenzoate polyprenyltransferase
MFPITSKSFVLVEIMPAGTGRLRLCYARQRSRHLSGPAREFDAFNRLVTLVYQPAHRMYAAIIQLLRPKEWVKNGFVCTGIIFDANSRQSKSIEAMVLAFAAFCLMASCVYVVNDYIDRESDRKHPLKRNRPIASGAINARDAAMIAVSCAFAATLTGWFADPRVVVIVLVYLVINIAYSTKLKHLPVVDVFCIALGFMLRILAGTWAIRISPSGWLLLTGMFVTLFLGFAKRRAEWNDTVEVYARRPVLRAYTYQLLDTFLSITATGTVITYGLYTLDAKTIDLHHTDKLIYTLPFVLFGLFRYLFLLHSRNKGENPRVDVFTDHQIILCGLGFTGSALWLLNR